MNKHNLGAALVTGGARRIGRAIALKMAECGYSVAVHYNESAAAAEALCADIQSRGGKACAVRCDLAEAAGLARCVEEASTKLGPLTLLVNNASMFVPDRLQTMSRSDWRNHFAVNVEAPVFLAQAFAAALPDEHKGCIVNIIDQRVWRPTPQYYSYSASKAALWAATQTMAQALAPQIRVNAIGPGPVLASVHQDSAEFQAQWRATLLQRATPPEEIADAVLFLAQAPAVTGQMIALDSGQHLAWQTPDTEFDGD